MTRLYKSEVFLKWYMPQLTTVLRNNHNFLSTVSEYEPAVNEVEVPVLNRDLCNQWLEHRDLNVTEGMICAGYPEGGKDACQVRFKSYDYLPIIYVNY